MRYSFSVSSFSLTVIGFKSRLEFFSSNIPQLLPVVHKPNLNPLEFLHVYVLLNRNTENVVYLLKKFQVFSYLGSKCQKWCTNKRGQVPLFFLTLTFFFDNVPQQTEHLEEPFLALRIYLLKKTMFMLLWQDIPKNARWVEKRFRNFKYSGKKITRMKLEKYFLSEQLLHTLLKWLCYNSLKVAQNSFQTFMEIIIMTLLSLDAYKHS